MSKTIQPYIIKLIALSCIGFIAGCSSYDWNEHNKDVNTIIQKNDMAIFIASEPVGNGWAIMYFDLDGNPTDAELFVGDYTRSSIASSEFGQVYSAAKLKKKYGKMLSPMRKHPNVNNNEIKSDAMVISRVRDLKNNAILIKLSATKDDGSVVFHIAQTEPFHTGDLFIGAKMPLELISEIYMASAEVEK